MKLKVDTAMFFFKKNRLCESLLVLFLLNFHTKYAHFQVTYIRPTYLGDFHKHEGD
jgi:hypothetical protein